MKEHTTFRLEPEYRQKVRQLAKKNKLSTSEQYRFIIHKFFSNWFKEIFK